METDFLDVTFNLATMKYFFIRKANSTLLYIMSFLTTYLQLSDSCLKRLTRKFLDLSCNKEEFDEVKSVYEAALKD